MARKNPMDPRDVEICQRLLDYRKARGWTRAEMSVRTGLPTSRLSNYEHRAAALPYGVADQICRKLDLNQEWLASGEGLDFPYHDLEADGVPKLKEVQFKRFSHVMESVGSFTQVSMEKQTVKLVEKGILSQAALESDDPEEAFAWFSECWMKRIPKSYWPLFLQELSEAARKFHVRLRNRPATTPPAKSKSKAS